MNRKTFIYSCSAACISGTGILSLLLKGCAGTRHVTGNMEENLLTVSVENFTINKKNEISYRKYIVVIHGKLQYPIVVHRKEENSFSAYLMKCTHQGNELSAYGDKLVCPAHGSEFDKDGKATSGPATEPLRSFKVTLQNNLVKISLNSL